MKVKVVIEKAEGEGFSAYCPTSKGCWSQGRTEEEALKNIRDAVRQYIKTLGEVTKSKHTYDIEVAI